MPRLRCLLAARTTPRGAFKPSVTREEITKQTPEKSLVEKKQRTGGRNSTGRVTSRFIGGGHKQAYRVIDFKRDKTGIPATVAAVEYDPNRSARIALLNYADGEKRYIIHPDGLKVGQKVMSGPRCRYPAWQCPAAEEYAGRHHRPQHRVAARQGRADGAFGRFAGAVGFAAKAASRC